MNVNLTYAEMALLRKLIGEYHLKLKLKHLKGDCLNANPREVEAEYFCIGPGEECDNCIRRMKCYTEKDLPDGTFVSEEGLVAWIERKFRQYEDKCQEILGVRK